MANYFNTLNLREQLINLVVAVLWREKSLQPKLIT